MRKVFGGKEAPFVLHNFHGFSCFMSFFSLCFLGYLEYLYTFLKAFKKIPVAWERDRDRGPGRGVRPLGGAHYVWQQRKRKERDDRRLEKGGSNGGVPCYQVL